jgi:hypothetical protein
MSLGSIPDMSLKSIMGDTPVRKEAALKRRRENKHVLSSFIP